MKVSEGKNSYTRDQCLPDKHTGFQACAQKCPLLIRKGVALLGKCKTNPKDGTQPDK